MSSAFPVASSVPVAGKPAGPETPMGRQHCCAVRLVAGEQAHDQVCLFGQPALPGGNQRACPAGPANWPGALADVVAGGTQRCDLLIVEPAAPFHQHPLARAARGPAGHPADGGNLQVGHGEILGLGGQHPPVPLEQAQHRDVLEEDDGTQAVQPIGVSPLHQRIQQQVSEPGALVAIATVNASSAVPGLIGT